MDDDGQQGAGIISRLRNDFGLLFVVIRYAVVAFIAIILLGTAVLSVLAWRSSASLGDRAAEIGAIFAGMTLLLTMFAAVIAYIAFSVSFGFPDLSVQISFGPSRTNRLTVAAERKNGQLEATDATQTELAICFRNEGRYPAKELAVAVRLDGMEFVPDETVLNLAGWTVNERSRLGSESCNGMAAPLVRFPPDSFVSFPRSTYRVCVPFRMGSRGYGRSSIALEGIASSFGPGEKQRRTTCRKH
jgi:hypothetical protein